MTMYLELQCWDNGGKTYDRYTVVWPDGSYLGMSEHPFHPQGFGQHGEGAEYFGDPPDLSHFGRRVELTDLPPDCIRCVLQDLDEEDWDDCESCGGQHPQGYVGDCRNDAMRR